MFLINIRKDSVNVFFFLNTHLCEVCVKKKKKRKTTFLAYTRPKEKMKKKSPNYIET